jgi:hypothetical protein
MAAITLKTKNRCSICIFILFFLFSNASFSANRYWIGLTGNWNNILNWSNTSGGLPCMAVPGSADVAVFDGNNLFNCTIDVSTSVSGILISNLYTGTVSLSPGIGLTIASAGFIQTNGNFNGSNANISVSGPFSLTGGTFTSTTSTLLLSGGFSNAGTFNHNNGTVSFSTTQSISGNTSFNNLSFIAGGGVYTIVSGTTLSSSGNVTISGTASCTINTGIVEILGDLTLASSSNNTVNGGSATFRFSGTGVQNIYSSIGPINVGTNERMCCLPNVEINKTSGSLNLSGLINMNGTSWNTIAGASLINAGTSTLNIISSATFSGQNLSLYNIHIYANGQAITLNPATYKLTSTHNVTINGGSYYQVNTGILEILGDLNLVSTSTSTINGGTGTMLFGGTAVQNINSSASTNFICALPGVEINKSSGALNLNGIINVCGASWNTIAGNTLINPGTSTINILKNCIISGQDLSLYDIIITGNFSTVTINSGVTWTSSHLVTLGGGTSWYQVNTGTLNAKGDVLVTNTNTSNNVGGTALLLFSGSANQLLTGSGVAGGGRLPRVQIDKTGGILTLSNSMISMDNNWTYVSGTVDALSNSSTLDFYKTAVIDGEGASAIMTFKNIICSGFISLGGKADIDGDLMIRNDVNSRLDVSASNYQLNLAGNWINNNSVTALSFNQENGKVIFDGNSAQSLNLAAATHNETFYNLEIKNTSGLTLNGPVIVSSNLNFVTGTISSSAVNTLQLGNLATATGAGNASFVSGPVIKTGNQAFTFPVGRNAVYAPLSISAPASSTDQFTAEYFAASPNSLYNVSSKDASLDHISICEYWTLARTGGSSGVSVGLGWDNRSCGVTSLPDLRIARWNGTQWKDHGNGGTTGNTTAGTISSSSALSSFGPFTLSSISTTNPLPIELLSFSAACDNGHNLLSWSTASETNNDHFTVERSADGNSWQEAGKVAGAGTSAAANNYSFRDEQSTSKLTYYRLKQTDHNGLFSYFSIISAEPCQNSDNGWSIYPNPSSGVFHLASNKTDPFTNLEVFDITGNRVYYGEQASDIDLSGLPDGVYMIRGNKGGQAFSRRIAVERR